MPYSKPVSREVLRARLDQLVETFDISTIEPDPLQLVLRYDEQLDQEVAGLLAAAFAYGRAGTVVANVGAVLARMRPSPYRFLLSFDRTEAESRFAGFSHRFHKTRDLLDLFERLSAVIETWGSLGELFRFCYEPRDSDIGPSLTRFVEHLLSAEHRPSRDHSRARSGRRVRDHPRVAAPSKGLQYLLSSPARGSACKRMNLYLRWMVRRTSPDLGLWTFVEPSKLVMPVDTHIHRIATFLGLNARRSADWIAARRITDELATFDRFDPVRYDFALCRLGILDLCSRKRKAENCEVCLLRDACSFPVLKSNQMEKSPSTAKRRFKRGRLVRKV